MRILPAVVTILCLVVAPAFAQPAGQSRVSLHVGAGTVSPTSLATPGQVALLTIGTDVRLSRNWSVRIETGRRVPDVREWVTHTTYYFDAPDGGQPIGVDSTTLGSDRTVADITVLVRRAWPLRRRYEIGLLGGLDLQVVRYRSRTTIPTSLTDPNEIEVFEFENRRTLGVFDVGVDAGARVSDRWQVLVYGIAGLQPLLDENRTAQLRAGVLLKRDF